LELYHLEQHIENLTQQVWNNCLTRKQQWEYEDIDCLSSEAKKYAETKCQKLKVGHIPWCPQITKAIAQILYWKGIWKRKRGGHIGSQQLQHLAKRRGDPQA